MIDETTGPGPEETAAPETAPETAGTETAPETTGAPEGEGTPVPESPSPDAGMIEPPAPGGTVPPASPAELGAGETASPPAPDLTPSPAQGWSDDQSGNVAADPAGGLNEPAVETSPEVDGEQPFALGGDQVAEEIERDQARGYRGQEVDQAPNEEYTAPTPETPEGSDAQ